MEVIFNWFKSKRALTFSRYDADASQLFQNLNCKNLSTQRDIQKTLSNGPDKKERTKTQ